MSDERICWNNFDKMFSFSKPLMRPKGLFTCLLRKALLAKFFGEKKNKQNWNNIWKFKLVICISCIMDGLIQTSWSDAARSVRMENRWLSNVSSSLMLIVPYSLPSWKSDLSENMVLLLKVSSSFIVIWQHVGRPREGSYFMILVTCATEKNALS